MFRIIDFLKIKKRYIVGLSLLNLMYATIPVLEISVISKILNDISNPTYFYYFIGLLVAQAIVKQIIQFVDARMGLLLEKNFAWNYTQFLASIPYSEYEKQDLYQEIYFSKEMVQKLNVFRSSLTSLFIYSVRLIGYTVIISTKIWYLGILVLVLFVPVICIAIYSGNLEYESQLDSGNFFRRAGYLMSVLMNKESVTENRIFSFDSFIKNKWREQQDQAILIEKRILFFSELYAVAGIIGMMICLLIIFSIMIIFGGNQISFGLYVSLFGAFLVFTDEISYNLSQLIRKLIDSHLFLKKFHIFLSISTNKMEEGEKIGKIKRIEFKQVRFSYGENAVLKDCSFILEEGKRYALVGENGSGKTTIVKILLGLLPYEGSILINGKELSQIPNGSLREEMGVIFQDFNKYELSIEDNIALGKEESVADVLEMVGLNHKLAQFEDKEKTMLGKLDNGVQLSLGEWQKVALARILIRNNSCMIFDEPTASLDAISEREIIESINKQLSDEVISFWITHRLGSCKESDEILVLKDGRIHENGSFEQLISKDGYFSKLYKTQRSFYNE